MIANGADWMAALNARNRMSHSCSETAFEAVIAQLREVYLDLLTALHDRPRRRGGGVSIGLTAAEAGTIQRILRPWADRIARLWTLFDESDLPVSVDLIAYGPDLYPPLRAHINAAGVTLFDRAALLAAD